MPLPGDLNYDRSGEDTIALDLSSHQIPTRCYVDWVQDILATYVRDHGCEGILAPHPEGHVGVFASETEKVSRRCLIYAFHLAVRSIFPARPVDRTRSASLLPLSLLFPLPAFRLFSVACLPCGCHFISAARHNSRRMVATLWNVPVVYGSTEAARSGFQASFRFENACAFRTTRAPVERP